MPGAQLAVPDRAEVLERSPGVFGQGGDRGPDLAVQGDIDREEGARAADRPDRVRPVERRVQPDDDRPGQPHDRAVPIACAANPAAPRAEAAFPPRSRVAAITGADSGVLMSAASTFRPFTSGDFP